MAKVLIVYHSQTGNTEEMARAVAEGARSVAGTDVVLKRAFDANADDLIGCNAVAFGTPTNFAYISGGLKDFFDRSLIQCQDKTTDKPYCTFTSSGMGKRKALDVLDGICSAYKLKKADEGIMAPGKATPEILAELRQMGKKLATA
ncbi:MAG: flavodoxin [Dehalococcoidia bacterium]|nr:flavodoxin [Dehalococcoidia bacterium]